MISTLVLLLLILSAIVLPAMLGWWMTRSLGRRARLVATLVGGMVLVVPYFYAVARVEAIGHDPDAMMAVWFYGGIALLLAGAIFLLLERRVPRVG